MYHESAELYLECAGVEISSHEDCEGQVMRPGKVQGGNLRSARALNQRRKELS